MNQGDDETQGVSKTSPTSVILGWDEVFGLHLLVRGTGEATKRLADALADDDIGRLGSGEIMGRLRQAGWEPVQLREASRNERHEREVRAVLRKLGHEVRPDNGVECAPCPYGERLRPLLRHGSYFDGVKPPTAAELDLSAEADGPELMRMAVDPEFDQSNHPDAVWAPVWAWFLLGELKPAGAGSVLLGLLGRLDTEDGDEAVAEVLPKVFGKIGRAMAPALVAVLRDDARKVGARWAAVNGLREIALAWPETRTEMVAILIAQLDERAVRDAEVNGAIIDGLINLEAVESAGAIERAFRATRVDETIAGDWESVQVELGLKDGPEFVPEAYARGGSPVRRAEPKVGRNDPCPCGSGKKFKKCCGG